VLATFVLLFLMTGSVLVPLKALLMKRGLARRLVRVLVWVFQQGNLEVVAGLHQPAASRRRSRRWVLAFGFGLAMDYRCSCCPDQGGAGRRGRQRRVGGWWGLQRSGRIISSAAVIIVLVFSGFVAGSCW
jgi:RND superfamily putative drug exporter